MRSLDTNVLVRVILADDPKQSPVADRIIAEPALVTTTVALETFWVLAEVAGLTKAKAAAALQALMKIDSLTFADAAAVAWALERAAGGGDFADMLHVATSRAADSFATFDRGVAHHAGDSGVTIETL